MVLSMCWLVVDVSERSVDAGGGVVQVLVGGRCVREECRRWRWCLGAGRWSMCQRGVLTLVVVVSRCRLVVDVSERSVDAGGGGV